MPQRALGAALPPTFSATCAAWSERPKAPDLEEVEAMLQRLARWRQRSPDDVLKRLLNGFKMLKGHEKGF